jgi:hypothetical protein
MNVYHLTDTVSLCLYNNNIIIIIINNTHIDTNNTNDTHYCTDTAEAAYWEQMYKAKVIDRRLFALCFSRSNSVDRKGTPAGAMSFGGVEKVLHDTPMVYASSGESGGFFGIHVRKIYMRAGAGGTSVQSVAGGDGDAATMVALDVDEGALNRGEIIVDSGTTDTYFPRVVTKSFKDVFQQMMGKEYTHAATKLTAEQVLTYPTVIFQLSGDVGRNKAVADGSASPVPGLAGMVDADHPYDVLIAMPPTHYFEYDEESDTYEARFYTDEAGGGVLGANAMMGHDVYFDVEGSAIGWAESDCDYMSRLGKYYTGPMDSEMGADVDEAGGGRVEPEEGKVEAEVEAEHGEVSEPKSPEAPYPENYQYSNGSDEPSLPAHSFCSSLTCQISFLGVAVVSVMMIAVRLLRRVPVVVYEPAELEMQVTSAQSGDSQDDVYDDDEFVRGGYGGRLRVSSSGDEVEGTMA